MQQHTPTLATDHFLFTRQDALKQLSRQCLALVVKAPRLEPHGLDPGVFGIPQHFFRGDWRRHDAEARRCRVGQRRRRRVRRIADCIGCRRRWDLDAGRARVDRQHGQRVGVIPGEDWGF